MAHEDPWDDWEAAADAGFDPKPIKIVDEHSKNKQIWNEANTHVQPIIIRTDTARTTYVPELQVLKRPKESDSMRRTQSHLDPSERSLEKREADYYAARQKIFGTNRDINDKSLAINSPKKTKGKNSDQGRSHYDSSQDKGKKLFNSSLEGTVIISQGDKEKEILKKSAAKSVARETTNNHKVSLLSPTFTTQQREIRKSTLSLEPNELIEQKKQPTQILRRNQGAVNTNVNV
ncbi:hypothetical protein G9A89_018189 [Geosiphon pyriformis]|nr:hypothetical protein G9A89_018189 [Geosiphon pyriformis]